MIVYSSTKSEFRQDVRDNRIDQLILEAYLRNLGHSTSKSEIKSWKNSMLYMSNILEDVGIPDNTGVAIEYKIPQTSKRIDFILTGTDGQNKNTAVIVELKQWSDAKLTDKDGIVKTFIGGAEREVNHPSYQAWTYAAFLEDFNEAVQEQRITLNPCAYLHNMESEDVIKNSRYQSYLQKAPSFIRTDAERLTDFIKQFIRYGDLGKVMFEIDNGKIRPSKNLADKLLSMLKGNEEFFMIDDQKIVYETALNLAQISTVKDKHVLIVEGEATDFSITGVGDAHRLIEEITSLAADNMEPALRLEFTVYGIDGLTVVAAEIDEIPASQKPCFYKTAGLPKGAYLRVGNTNRQMTEYEVFGYLSGREQPTHDEDIVLDASLEDLDNSLIETYLERLRQIRPRASFLKSGKEEISLRLRIAAQDSGAIRPTLAGLLMFGKYPQEFSPQLMITFVQYFGTTEDERTPQGARFVDNRRFEGPITEMVDEAETYIMSAMRKSSLIDGMFRRDITEYPRESLRQSIANSVAHRDYSPYVRGSYIQIRMFADRLEVRSPGGLFGNVTVDNWEDEHSTRNARLMRMMEDMQVVENRGSGISAMLHAMREANLEPPGFDDRRASFKVTFHNHTLMTAQAISWLNQFSHLQLNDHQRLALVYLRQHSHIDNRDCRRLNRVDTMTAGQDLRGMVQTSLVEQTGFGRWTKYVLKVKDVSIDNLVHISDEEKILSYVIKHGSINNSECRELLNVNDDRAYYLLKKLSEKGKLKTLKKGKGRRYVVP